jgi:hypothetical protein
MNYIILNECHEILDINDDLTRCMTNLYVVLTNAEMRHALDGNLYATIRFIYEWDRQSPSDVILIRVGEECNIGDEIDEFDLDSLIISWHEQHIDLTDE